MPRRKCQRRILMSGLRAGHSSADGAADSDGRSTLDVGDAARTRDDVESRDRPPTMKWCSTKVGLTDLRYPAICPVGFDPWLTLTATCTPAANLANFRNAN